MIIWIPTNHAEAKGRNGYFKVDQAEVSAITDGEDTVLHLTVWPYRKGKSAPLALILSPQDMFALGKALQKAALEYLISQDLDRPL